MTDVDKANGEIAGNNICPSAQYIYLFQWSTLPYRLYSYMARVRDNGFKRESRSPSFDAGAATTKEEEEEEGLNLRGNIKGESMSVFPQSRKRSRSPSMPLSSSLSMAARTYDSAFPDIGPSSASPSYTSKMSSASDSASASESPVPVPSTPPSTVPSTPTLNPKNARKRDARVKAEAIPPQLISHLPIARAAALETFSEIKENWYQYKSLGNSRELLESNACDCTFDPGGSCSARSAFLSSQILL